MKLTRIDNEKDLKKEIKIIQVEIGDTVFRIQQFGDGIVINKVNWDAFDNISILPSAPNQIKVF